MVGSRFGRLTVVSFDGKRGYKKRYLCRCDCGSEVVVQSSNLRSGHTTSCGCWRRERSAAEQTTHGRSTSPVWRIWSSMRERCTNGNNKKFHLYGGRGITVCERWQRFENFLADMGERPDGMMIERVDNGGNYEPGNCRWATPHEQKMNRRVTVMATYKGVTKPLLTWCEELNLPFRKTASRLGRQGWSVDRAFAAR